MNGLFFFLVFINILLLSVSGGVIPGCRNNYYDFSQLNNGEDIASEGQLGDGFTYFFQACGAVREKACISDKGVASFCGVTNGQSYDFGSFDSTILFSPLPNEHGHNYTAGVTIQMLNGETTGSCTQRATVIDIYCNPNQYKPVIIEPFPPALCVYHYSYSHFLACGFPKVHHENNNNEEQLQIKEKYYVEEQ